MSARFVIGIGARKDIDARELADLVREVAARHGVDLQSATLATIEARGDEPGLQIAARLLEHDRGFSAARKIARARR